MIYSRRIRGSGMLRAYAVCCALCVCFFMAAARCYSDEAKSTEAGADAGVTVVTIKNARRTGNKKSDLDGSSIIILEGDVVVSVKKEKTVTTISADVINYNREKDILYAEGNIELETTNGNEGGEKVTADTLLFNTATLEGIFDNGRIVQTQSDSINLPSGSTLIVASDIFGRDDSGTIAFKSGELTFCPEDPPHWRIKATRIWLLPGGEFAFFNAVLFVGSVPLLYLPAFWYPKDELIFNPVFGYRNRQGYFVQTTTYLFGRKPLSAYDVSDQYTASSGESTDDDSDTDESYYSFVKPSKLKVQERQGLMLHNLDEDYTGDTTNYGKLMLDWYANLGMMTGFDSVYKTSDGSITNAETNLQLGFSNTVFQQGANYLAYSPTGKMYKDSSSFLGVTTPFRYKANIQLTVAKPFSLTVSMPLYSDPYFTTDFGRRTETMDWIDYLISNPNSDTTTSDENDTTAEISSFTWALHGSYSPQVADALQPWITSWGITSLSSQMIFTSTTNTKVSADITDGWGTYSPERKFYYPSQVNPVKITGKISGTLLSFDSTESSAKNQGQQFSIPLMAPDELRESAVSAAAPAADAQNGASDSGTSADGSPPAAGDASAPDLSPEMLPGLAFSADAIKTLQGVSYKLTYTITPSYSTEIAYAVTSTSSSTGVWLNQPEDFEWNRMRSFMHLVNVPVNLTSAASYRENFITLTDTLDFSPVYQWHPYLSDDTKFGGYSESSIKSIKKTDYAARKMDLTNTNALGFKPFYYTEHFKNTGVSYNTTIKVVRTEFVGDADNPAWDYLTADASDENSITVHSLAFTLAATEGGDLFGQSLTLTSTLPPQVDEYYGKLELKFPYTVFTAETGIKQTSSTDDTWIKEDFKQALTVSFGSGKVKFTESFNHNLETWYKDSLKLALTAYDFQFAYTAKYTYGYDFETVGSVGTWKTRSEKEFLPYSMSIAYASSNKNFRYWRKRISWAPSLSTSLVYDFLKPTASYFKFIPSVTFQLNKFLYLSFASESRNDVIYRYFQNMSGSKAKIAGETNVFMDLLDSFRFDDETKRKASGFKLNSLAVKVTHELCDWDFSASFKVSPRLVTNTDGTKYYDFSPYFTLSVVWRPMNGMKTKVVDKYGDWQLNP